MVTKRKLMLLASAVAAPIAFIYCNGSPSLVPETHATWPARPDADIATNTTVTTFAIDTLDFGERDRANFPGFDLDGKITTRRSTDVCTRFVGAGTNVQVDLTNDSGSGVDNSFAVNILPINETLFGRTLTSMTTDLITRGRFTLQLQPRGPEPLAGSTALGLTLQSFRSGVLASDGATPTWSPMQEWPVRTDGIVDGSMVQSRDDFESAYVTQGTVVSGLGAMTLSIALSKDAPVDLPLTRAIVVMKVNGDDASGTIAGVLDVEGFLRSLHAVSGLSHVFCEGAAFDGIANQIRQASDILNDGSNREGVPCNAISFGVRFTARRIANPTRTEAPPDLPDVCAPPPDAAAEAAVDSGFMLGCSGPADCVDAGVDGGSAVCCGKAEITPACQLGGVTASCASASSCPSNIEVACGYTASVRLCGSSSDCTEPLFPRCCKLPVGTANLPYACVSTLLSTGASCK